MNLLCQFSFDLVTKINHSHTNNDKLYTLTLYFNTFYTIKRYTTRSFEMTMRRIGFTMIVSALIIAIATAGFSIVNVLAQMGNNTITGPSISSSPTAKEPTTVHITKDSTNSYVISGQVSNVGSFDTTYRVAGERGAIMETKNLIISTITSDFTSSPTIGYIRVGNTSALGTNATALANPFATTEMITQKITNELTNTIGHTESNTAKGQHVEIACEFGMALQDMRCQYTQLLGMR
jgi:hypothetical protein